MNPFKSSLYWRLLIWFCAANLLVLVLSSFLTQRFIEYSSAVEIDWTALAQDANQQYESGGIPALAQWRSEQRHQGIDATLYENGEPLIPIRLPASVKAVLSESMAAGHDLVIQPRPRMYLAVTQLTGRHGKARQFVAMSRTHQRVRPQTRSTILLGVQLALSLVFVGLIGWWLARSVARPVEALRNATRRMAAGELSTRVGRIRGTRYNELAQLARDFDAMAERIEALVAHDRRVLQDLSHELRSPLARLQLILDMAQRSDDRAAAAAYFEQAETEIIRLDRMTGEMLALSRLEGGIPGLAFDELDLVELSHAGTQQAQLEASAVGVVLQLQAPDKPVLVVGSAQLIARAIDNLLGNAIKFSSRGGTAQLIISVTGCVAEIAVEDNGPGVREAELDSLFRPFFRGSNAASAEGHGLGLAIVQRVVTIHGGELSASNRDSGGLRVSMRLPLTAAGAPPVPTPSRAAG
jgi:two-component system OmpR family sensor kinase